MQILKVEFLAVYGTLRRRSLYRRGPSVSAKLGFFCSGRLRGRLFCQGSYPAAVLSPGIIPVEVFVILDQTVWDDLDRYEGCNPTHEPSSLFYRQRVRLLRPSVIAWVYFLGHRQFRGNVVDPWRANQRCSGMGRLKKSANFHSKGCRKKMLAKGNRVT
jgi:gamma-glutamylcyclotransferase (GGCT)/AIG2-like uncharacterized protein YtfP